MALLEESIEGALATDEAADPHPRWVYAARQDAAGPDAPAGV